MMHDRPASNDSLDYERIGRFVYSFHRICGSVDVLTEIGLDRTAPQELAKRAASLARTFDRILKDAISVPESEIDSALREASAVQTGINEWLAGKSGR
ncbi:hypothetical protein [Pseudoduganella rhizocola]|uniref:hypothetical protein n=1 Tax=Pseudoduganella rhizocola TaxID=3382643 RepID=UPI0038B4C751